MTKTAKLWVNHASMMHNPADHAAYLTGPGHQQSADSGCTRTWTKSMPKEFKTDRSALVKHWRGIHEKFVHERQTPGTSVHHNAKVTARQFVVNLPNNITEKQVDQLAKTVLKDFPRHIPVSMVLHRESNRAKKHMHLQGLFSYRNGGYGQINEDFRLNITKQMKQAVTAEFKRFGYTVDLGKPRSINNKQRQWLSQQGSVEQLRNPRFLASIATKTTSKRLQNYCMKLIASMKSRMQQSDSPDQLLQTLNTMVNLSSTYSKESDNRVQTPATPDRRAEQMPLTPETLQKQLLKARRWKTHTKSVSRNI